MCHASLIEDLPEEGYEFVLPSRFQSGPIEQRFAQYQQMSGERFLAGLKDVNRRKKNYENQEFIERRGRY